MDRAIVAWGMCIFVIVLQVFVFVYHIGITCILIFERFDVGICSFIFDPRAFTLPYSPANIYDQSCMEIDIKYFIRKLCYLQYIGATTFFGRGRPRTIKCCLCRGSGGHPRTLSKFKILTLSLYCESYSFSKISTIFAWNSFFHKNNFKKCPKKIYQTSKVL